MHELQSACGISHKAVIDDDNDDDNDDNDDNDSEDIAELEFFGEL